MVLIGLYVTFVVAAVGIQLLPNVRRGAVMRAGDRLTRAAAPAQPGEDWPTLYARIESRVIGHTLGWGAGMTFAAVVFVLADPRALDAGAPLVVLLATSLSTVGALFGHLWGVRGGRRRPGLASLHRRELQDYLTPSELRLVRLAVVVPLLTVVLGVVTAVHDDPSLGAIQIGGGVLSLGVGALARPLARWSLTASSSVSTPGGLAWAEVLRGMLLRDVVSGLWGTATITSGLVPVLAWMSGSHKSALGNTLGVLVVALAIAVNVGFAWVSRRDVNHRWARQHAVRGVSS